MAFAQVQTSAAADGSGNSIAVTTSATTEGNLIVVHIKIYDKNETCTGVTDDQSNTYVLQTAVDSTTERSYQAYAMQVTGGVTTITVAFSGTSSNKRCGADEYSGMGTGATNADVFDASTTGSGAGSPTAVSTLTPSAAGNLIVATLNIDNAVTWTAGANYTLYFSSASMRSQYRLSSDTSETALATHNGGGSLYWAERATAFKAKVVVPVSSGFFALL